MKRSMIALSVLAVLTVSACTHGGTWTPQGAGRTAGEGSYETMSSSKADKTFSQTLTK